MKRCPKCGEIKSRLAFNVSDGRPSSWCKSCTIICRRNQTDTKLKLLGRRRRSLEAGVRLRLEAIRAYGGDDLHCVCCGEDMFEFLELDHVNNNGTEHRRLISGNPRAGMYAPLKRLGWPHDERFPIQLLCSNCNYAKFRYGSCPHTWTPEYRRKYYADRGVQVALFSEMEDPRLVVQ